MIKLAYIRSVADVSDYFGDFYLSCWFRYKPIVQKKRIIHKQTVKGSFTQKTYPLFNPGNDFIEWEIELHPDAVFVADLKERYDSDELFEFNGIWGEQYIVEFSEFDIPEIIGGKFKIEGKFRIICVLTDFMPSCNPTTPTTPAP